jgi:hypothetical protein
MKGRERQGVGADKHLAIAIADRERAAAAGADQQVVPAGKEEDEREGAIEAFERSRDRLRRVETLRQIMRHEVCDGLGVGVGVEGMAEPGELFFERLEILDDAVMHDRDLVGRDRVRVFLDRLAVRRPACVADADRAAHRLLLQPRDEVRQFAFGAAALDAAIDQGGDARGIIAAVFEALQGADQFVRDGLLCDDPDDAAHQRFFPLSFSRNCAARPALFAWRARAIVSASFGTFSVTTLPVAT